MTNRRRSSSIGHVPPGSGPGAPTGRKFIGAVREYRASLPGVPLLPMLACLAALATRVDAAALSCAEGSPATADLGDGVTMLTCLREREPGKAVRVGPVRLVRNGIVILSAQTNADGKLHGRYVVRDDDGSVTEQGDYAHGLKIGKWLQIDPSGKVTTVHYRDGVPIEP